VSNKISKEE